MSNIERAHELYINAKEIIDEGKLEDGIQLLLESASFNEHFKTRELLGICYGDIGDFENARINLRIAYSLNQKSSKTACLFAQTLLSSGEIIECKKIIELVLINHTDYGPARAIQLQLAKMENWPE